jgi:hypothetical protein
LLLEGSGTNLITNSEAFNQWTQTNVDLNPDQVVAPNGTLTADEMLSTSGVTGNHRVVNAYTFSNAGDKTVSVYVKNKDAETIRINLYNPTDGNVALADIDLSDFSVSSGSATVSPVGNGWHRISLSGSYSAVYSQFFIQLVKGGNDSFTGDGTGVYLWGAQLEQNSYATSYIPTSGSTATRAADVSTSAATFGNSWYKQSEGTVYHLYNPFGVGSSRFYSFNDGTNNNQILGAASNGSGSASNYIEITAASVNQSFLGASGAYSPTLQTGALAYIVNNCAYSKNGGAVFVDTSVTIPIINTLNLGSDHSNSSILNGTIRRLTYWPTRLSNDTLQTITV